MKLVQLSGEKGKGKFAKVDDEDYDKVLSLGSWNYTPAGYACHSSHRDMKSIKTFMHRFIMEAPKGMEVDHINHDTLDNRKSNLRVCSHQSNSMNRKRKAKYYFYSARYKRWEVAYRGKYFGRYKTEQEAKEIVTKIKSGQEIKKSPRKRPMLPKGVRLMKNCNKRPFGAVVKENGKQKYLGCFETAKEAEEAYLKYWGERNAIL